MATGTGFPNDVDSYANKSAGDFLTIADLNKMLSGLEQLMVYLIDGKPWVLIETQQGSGTSIDFTTGIDSTYDEYRIEFFGVKPAQTGVDLVLRVAISGTFQDGADYDWMHYGGGAVAGGGNSAAYVVSDDQDNQINLAVDLGTAAGQFARGNVCFSAPSNGTYHKVIMWEVGYILSATALVGRISGAGRLKNVAAINGIRFLMSAGNISAGVFKLFGRKK